MLGAISFSLKDRIESATPDLAAGWVTVASLSGEDKDPAANKAAIFLYAVHEHPHLRNQPLVQDQGGYRRAPAALRLSYLVTYVSDSHEEAQNRLARVVQVFHSRPRLGPNELRPELVGQISDLTIRLTNPGPEEVNQIWTALNRGMRLSLYYQVDVAVVEPTDQPVVPPVQALDADLAPVAP